MPILLLAQLAFQAVFPGPLWGNLTPGSYGVGYMTQFVVDENRQWGPIPRQLPLLIFYPTTQRSPISTFRNYLELGEPADASRQIVSLMRERDLDTARRQFSPPDSGLFERLLDTPVAGARNATLAAGRFPLVLYALGLNDYQQENTVLWEFLTSHGFVVVVVPQLGASAEAFRMRFGAEAMRLQAADLMLVAARMRAAPYVAPLSPAYVGTALAHSPAFLRLRPWVHQASCPLMAISLLPRGPHS